jgi:hypothetical protein
MFLQSSCYRTNQFHKAKPGGADAGRMSRRKKDDYRLNHKATADNGSVCVRRWIF